MTQQLDLLAIPVADDAAIEVRRRFSVAGVWQSPDRVGEVATYRVGLVDGEVAVFFRYRWSDGRASALTIAAHALVGFARIELEAT